MSTQFLGNGANDIERNNLLLKNLIRLRHGLKFDEEVFCYFFVSFILNCQRLSKFSCFFLIVYYPVRLQRRFNVQTTSSKRRNN